MTNKIKVLVVDDSAFMRRAISFMLNSDPLIKVIGTASNGKECIEKVSELKPDVLSLDIEMPLMNGLEALKIIMEKMPLPVLILSSLTIEGAKATLDALELGAMDFIPKQLNDLSFNIMNLRDEIINKIKFISENKPKIKSITKNLKANKETNEKKEVSITEEKPLKVYKYNNRYDLVAIGSSTGGPMALKDILINLPNKMESSLIIVQHMPALFLIQFAKRLDSLCKINVKIAEEGEPIERSYVYIAPGGIHTVVSKNNSHKKIINLIEEPYNLYHRPSVDVMMTSVADVFTNSSLGVILTGMGCDGLKGIQAIKAKKGKVIAQDKKSCIVYGMPKAIVEAGLADIISPLDKIADKILSLI